MKDLECGLCHQTFLMVEGEDPMEVLEKHIVDYHDMDELPWYHWSGWYRGNGELG